MNEGKFLQIGTPNEIYETPQTVFVASFMGATNIFLGKVVSKKDAKIELETKDGSRIFAPTPQDIGRDDIAGFSIHPELINIGPVDTDSQPLDPERHTTFHGIIKELFYQGNFSEITVLVTGIDMPLTVHLTRGSGSEIQLSEGQDVTVSWDYTSNNVLTG